MRGLLCLLLGGAAAFAPRRHVLATTRAARAPRIAPAPPAPLAARPAAREAIALFAARKKTADMTEEEKAAETAMNQRLLAAKGALFAVAIAYYVYTTL